VWQKNKVDIANSNSASYLIPSATISDANKYRVIVKNSYGADTSKEFMLTITTKNSRPKAFITSPIDKSLFSGGQVIAISGNATDIEDGTLASSSFTWTVSLHHNDHIHDGVPQSGMKDFTFTVPSTGHTETTVYYRVLLIVTDGGGLKDTAYVDIMPRLVNLMFVTNPAGLKVTLDGQTLQTPDTVQSIVGVNRQIGPIVPQSLGGKVFDFNNWQQGGAIFQEIITPENNETYTALYKELPLTDIVLSPIHDAYVQSNTSWLPTGENTTFGTTDSTQLITKTYTQGPNRHAYLTFNLKNIDLSGGKELISAKLKLYGMVENSTGTKSIGAQLFESNSTTWNEKTITYANRPGYNNANVIASNTITDVTGVNYYWDVTISLKESLSFSKTAVSYVLVNTGDNVLRALFNSKDANSNRPELFVSLGIPTGVSSILSEESSFNFYPNPAENELYLDVCLTSSGQAEISVTDLWSNTILNQTVNGNNGNNVFKIGLGNMKPGLYLVHFNLGENSLHRKILIK